MPLTISFTVSDEDLAIIGHDVLDPAAWCEHAARHVIQNKVDRSAARMSAQFLPVLDADPAVRTIPADPRERIAAIQAHKDYKNRVEREG